MTCPRCKGSGSVRRWLTPEGTFTGPCLSCEGTGRLPADCLHLEPHEVEALDERGALLAVAAPLEVLVASDTANPISEIGPELRAELRSALDSVRRALGVEP